MKVGGNVTSSKKKDDRPSFPETGWSHQPSRCWGGGKLYQTGVIGVQG